jgi:L-threonylcarbamoyladenylate synthase
MRAESGAEILATDTPARFAEAVRQASARLQVGELVALPTETVYGLAANAFDIPAVTRIFEVKGRPVHNPIIVHVTSEAMARLCVAHWPELATRLSTAFWPGPLTIVLPRARRIPDIVTAGGATVGVRWPSHPFIQAVINECGFPLAAPSANLANRASPTTAHHVQCQLGSRIPLIIDGGPCQVGIESTVLDLSVSPPHLLRHGMIHQQALIAVAGRLTIGDEQGAHVLKSPGLLQKHYAPRARLTIWAWTDDADLKSRVAQHHMRNSQTFIIAHTHIPSGEGFGGVSVIPHDAEAFARAIYAELHRCDQAGAEWIIVEAVPEKVEWEGVKDRLKRAATV